LSDDAGGQNTFHCQLALPSGIGQTILCHSSSVVHCHSHETIEFFHRFRALVKLFYTSVVCTVYSAQNLSHTSPSPCVFASMIFNFMGYEIEFSEFPHRNFLRDSEGQLLNSYAFILCLGPW